MVLSVPDEPARGRWGDSNRIAPGSVPGSRDESAAGANGQPIPSEQLGYEHALRVAARKHDLIPVQLIDPREENLPDLGLVLAQDLESDELVEIDTGDAWTREQYSLMVARQRAAREQLFRRLRLDYLAVYTDRPYVKPIADLFRLRQKRMQRY